jgi:hypothetical protein
VPVRLPFALAQADRTIHLARCEDRFGAILRSNGLFVSELGSLKGARIVSRTEMHWQVCCSYKGNLFHIIISLCGAALHNSTHMTFEILCSGVKEGIGPYNNI